MKPHNEPNPYDERIEEIIKHSHSLGAAAGDLVRLNDENVVAIYRQGSSNEPYQFMIERYKSLSSPYHEFIVLSCGAPFKDYIAEIIVKAYRMPHPCYTYPCPQEE